MSDSGDSSKRVCMPARPRLLALRMAGFVVLLVLSHPASFAEGRGGGAETPNKVEAAFLRNFAHYVKWPSNAFPDASSPWCIGVLGKDPFGEVLEKTFQGRTEQGRSFDIHRADTLDQLPQRCHIVFIAYRDSGKIRTALEELKGRPVLTVSRAPDFLRDGGIIRFRIVDRVQMSINLDQARAVSLNIQTKMLEVSEEVQENGVVRKVR